MPEFLAETYAPRGDGVTPAPVVADVARAAEQADGPEGLVRFLGAWADFRCVTEALASGA